MRNHDRQRDAHNEGRAAADGDAARTVRRAAIHTAAAGALLLIATTLWFAGNLLLLFFASVLLALLLLDGARQLCRLVPLSHKVALPAVVALALLVLGATAWLLAPRVAEQSAQLWAGIPQAVENLRKAIEELTPFGDLASMLPDPQALFQHPSAVLARVGMVFGNAISGFANIAVVGFVSLYLAAAPQTYVHGLLRLAPPARRQRFGEVLRRLGDTLTRWLRGKLFSMLVVGALTAGGLALLGLPLALTLGIVAGLLDFIPYLGPVLAAVPAMLIAFSNDPVQALYVLLLFVGVQTVEGYLLLPVVERNTVSLPPALTIGMQVLMGFAFGLPGVALATPLTAVLAVLLRTLYVEDVLGEEGPQEGS